MKFDAVIIGGGAVGVQLALKYREKHADAQVLLIERNVIGGPSSTSASFGRMHYSGGHFVFSPEVAQQIIKESVKGHHYNNLNVVNMMKYISSEKTTYLEHVYPGALTKTVLEQRLDEFSQSYADAALKYNAYPQGRVTRSYKTTHPELENNCIYASYTLKEPSIDVHEFMEECKKKLLKDSKITLLEKHTAEVDKNTGEITTIPTGPKALLASFQKLSKDDYNVLFCCAGAYNDELCGEDRYYIREKIVLSYKNNENIAVQDSKNPYLSFFVGHLGPNRCCVTKYKNYFMFTTALLSQHAPSPRKQNTRGASIDPKRLTPLLTILNKLPNQAKKAYDPLIEQLKKIKNKQGYAPFPFDVHRGYVYSPKPDNNLSSPDENNKFVFRRISTNDKVSPIFENIPAFRIDINKLSDIGETCWRACMLNEIYFMNKPRHCDKAATAPPHNNAHDTNERHQLNTKTMTPGPNLYSLFKNDSVHGNDEISFRSSSSNSSNPPSHIESRKRRLFFNSGNQPPRKKQKTISKSVLSFNI